MDIRDRSGLPAVAVDVGLGVAFAAVLAVTATAIAESWGGAYWVFDCGAGLVVCVLALVRRRHPGWAAGAAFVVAAVAVVVARTAHLPAEPGPAATLGLSVLVGSAVRTLPIPWAATIAAGGLALVVGVWFTGLSTVMMLAAAGWLAALATAVALRLLDLRREAVAEQVRRDERLELARELHDVVAHHITGVVLHAQAARVVRRRHPE